MILLANAQSDLGLRRPHMPDDTFTPGAIYIRYMYSDMIQWAKFIIIVYDNKEVQGQRSACILALRKHAYSNILKLLPPKTENFQIRNSVIFRISAQNIDCRYSLEPPHRGGSNEYPQSMFLSRNKKNNAYPCKPLFYYIKVGFKGVKII